MTEFDFNVRPVTGGGSVRLAVFVYSVVLWFSGSEFSTPYPAKKPAKVERFQCLGVLPDGTYTVAGPQTVHKVKPPR